MAILHLHFYLPINDSYSLDDLVNYFRGRVGQIDPTKEREPKPDRFDDAGVYLDFRSNKATGTEDFKRSLRDPDGVVVYLGHSVLDFKNKRSLGLEALGHDKVEIKPGELMGLLTASKAKLVILA